MLIVLGTMMVTLIGGYVFLLWILLGEAITYEAKLIGRGIARVWNWITRSRK